MRTCFDSTRVRVSACVLIAALAAAGCSSGNGNGNGDQGLGGGGGGPSDHGKLLQDPPALVKSMTAGDLLPGIDNTVRQALFAQAGTPVCDVSVYKIEYTTVGGKNEDTDASGALMVPSGSDAKCHGGRAVVLYAHGTSTDKSYDITNLDDQENAEGLYLAAFFAAQGRIVVAPNYAGYDTSSLSYHPYLVAEQQSQEMIHALSAARSALPVAEAADTTDNGKLYILGYSQGGYVAMATQRALEASGETVTASVPMSGPYAMAGFLDAIFAGRVIGGAPVLGTFLFTAYQHAYGNVYGAPTDMFAAQYADGIDSLLPATVPRSQLYDQGLLPQRAFFDTTPPEPQYADITPATTPANLAPVFARGFGDQALITNGYRLAYLQDMQAHPDGGWPDTTTHEPATDPQLGLRQDLVLNDLRNWTPEAPTLLCGGHDDPTVLWLNTQLMDAYWTARAPDAPYTLLDVDAALSSNDPYESIKQRFGIAKDLVAIAAVAQGASDGGQEAVFEVYHAGLVAPFCLEAAQKFIQEQ